MGLGRRLSEAGPYVDRALRKGLEDAAAWDTNVFSGATIAQVDVLKACYRSSFVLAQKRHKYLSLVPWLLARLDKPGVKARCLEQYSTHQDHHAMTEMFLKPGSELRAHVDRIRDDGSGVSKIQQKWIDILQRIPLDDSLAESPHAVGNKLGRHGPKSSFAFVAASMRLEQNLVDVKRLSE